MSKTIQKLNKLNNPESFIQINLIKGFEYVDKAGEIVNKYHLNDKAPVFTMGLDGLVIEKPQDKVDILKITPGILWLKFSQIDSLDMLINLYQKNAKELLAILGVTKLSRIGWRNYFVYEFVSEDKFEKYFKNLEPLKGNNLISLSIAVKTNKSFSANLNIMPVMKSDSKTKAVLFDIDVFEEKEISVQNIETKLKEFLSYLKSDNGFLGELNKSFS